MCIKKTKEQFNKKTAFRKEKEMKDIKIQEPNNVCTMSSVMFQNYAKTLL